MYLNRFVRDLIKSPLESHVFPGSVAAKFTTRALNDIPTKLPAVRARASNAGDTKPGFEKVTDVVVDVWARDEDTAYAVSKFVYDLIVAAHKNQTVYTDGWIRKFECPVFPTNVPDTAMPDGVVRYLATYDLTVRHH